MNLVGPRVRQLREQKGLTQEQLTARCHLQQWPISRGSLAKIEARVRRVTDLEVAALARALDVEVQTLFIEAD
ncbi:helix-turn-helix domain-containing protein [Marinobacterium arenosum]|uniref:helix-turn-helix domain-containing protein n=1 Tax=Marinobacterium arenosum TaxID=2862496 RepID=UPI001C9827E2|nr:helix-turn-helix transcriptional regulator [Marinobacterium arenosum]MBY4676810.1 helix-turn-helix transcriptional regulator [Marinobacterium arenosum]